MIDTASFFYSFFNCFFIMGQIKEDTAYEGISYDYSTGEVRRYLSIFWIKMLRITALLMLACNAYIMSLL